MRLVLRSGWEPAWPLNAQSRPSVAGSQLVDSPARSNSGQAGSFLGAGLCSSLCLLTACPQGGLEAHGLWGNMEKHEKNFSPGALVPDRQHPMPSLVCKVLGGFTGARTAACLVPAPAFRGEGGGDAQCQNRLPARCLPGCRGPCFPLLLRSVSRAHHCAGRSQVLRKRCWTDRPVGGKHRGSALGLACAHVRPYYGTAVSPRVEGESVLMDLQGQFPTLWKEVVSPELGPSATAQGRAGLQAAEALGR